MSLIDENTILAFKAGRCFRREGTNTVEANPAKGAIVLDRGEDELLHFYWKNRDTGITDEVSFFSSHSQSHSLAFGVFLREIILIMGSELIVGLDSIPIGCDIRQGIASRKRWKGVCLEVLEL